MQIIFISLVACLASLLTFFSGFGLATLLTPAFALFYPINLAIALTAIVHFLNNLFKLLLMARYANVRIVVCFGLPGMVAALVGAWVLTQLMALEPVFTYLLLDRIVAVHPVKLTVAILMLGFITLEFLQQRSALRFPERFLPVGGILSGFFGGLSGHQGALRSAFLLQTELTKESFVATGTAVACLIDAARLGVYAVYFRGIGFNHLSSLLLPTLSAFLGVVLGRQLLHKITQTFVRRLIMACLIMWSFALGFGLI